MKNLLNKKCIPCESGVPPLTLPQVEEYRKQINSLWEVLDDGKKIKRKFKFKDFKEAIVFVNKVSEVAEEVQHHPDIKIFYNIVEITLWTHAIAGLSENDFIVAARIDQVGYR
jgi:4a-hydroxytetrahydrobiopterin dehydratase